MVFEPKDGSEPIFHEVMDFDGGGVALSMFNTDASVREFSESSFAYAKMRGYPIILATKNTILKK